MGEVCKLHDHIMSEILENGKATKSDVAEIKTLMIGHYKDGRYNEGLCDKVNRNTLAIKIIGAITVLVSGNLLLPIIVKIFEKFLA